MRKINPHLRRLRERFGAKLFTTKDGIRITERHDFFVWASRNPLDDQWQILHAGGCRWRVVPLSDRLADQVLPRLHYLRQPFSTKAASIVLNGMPTPATNTILSMLTQGGHLVPGNTPGTWEMA